MAEQSRDRVSQQFGNYQLVRFLGQGGFAEVYLGEHVFLKTLAAIKILHTHLTHDEQEGFLKEARTIARLTHPHIIRVLDFGMQGEQPFLVMDFAPNKSLRERHPRGTRITPDEVIAYIKQIAAALQYAHDEKVIHRDVKPENMLVGRDGAVLLGDFGISVVAQNTNSLSTKEIVGSAPYIAPEQLQGHPRPASDQYSLGVVVYEWLCGERPFQGSSTEIYGQHLFAPPPSLLAKNPALPPAIESVVMTALAKDPHQRFKSIQAFANALEQASQSQVRVATTQPAGAIAPTLPAQAARPSQMMASQLAPDALTTPQLTEGRTRVQRPLSRRAVLAGLGALVVAGGSGTAWYLLTTHHYPPQGTLIYTYTKHQDSVLAVAWHDTRVASGSADKLVQVWDAATGNSVGIYTKHTGRVKSVAWSPDGQFIVSGSEDGTAQVWNVSTSNPVFNYTGHQQNGFSEVSIVAWSPDGQYIASGGNDNTVQVWHALTGQLIERYQGHNHNGFGSILSISWSHDSQQIASSGSDDTVQIWDALTGKNSHIFQQQFTSVNSLSWSPDSSQIASGTSNNTVLVWTPSVQGTALTYSGHTDAITSVAWSPNGQYIASASKDGTVHIWKPGVSTQAYIYKRHHDVVNAVAWADDSHRLASGSDDKTAQVWEGI